MSTVLEDALLEAAVDELRESRDISAVFKTGDADVDGALASPMSLSTTAEDRVTIIDIETGEPRVILANMARKTLAKKRNGKRAFTTVNPETGRPFHAVPEYQQGSVPCWFNEGSPRYETIRKIPGLETFTCPAAHLASEFDAELHAKNRHDRRYARVKDFMDRAEREEDRARQNRQIDAMLALAGGQANDRVFCGTEGCARFFDSEESAKMHRAKHKE